MVGSLLRRWVPTLLALAALVAAGATVTVVRPAPAAADDQYCWNEPVKGPDGTVVYERKCKTITPGQPGDPGGEDPRLACGIVPTPAPVPGFGAYYCAGSEACAIKDNIVPLAPPTTPAPPGQEWVAQACTFCNAGVCGPFGTPTLILTGGAQPRPLIVQAQEALGRIVPPTAGIEHSPTTKAVVALDTWFWLDPATFGVQRGTSAEGLVAIATPAATEWDPGDGSGVITCTGAGQPYTEGADGGCTHRYTAMSPRYDGQVTRHWTVRYEVNGAPVDIPGADLVLADLGTPFPITVVETQVVGGR
ncbi:MAG: hypothetical protein V7637_963 [Mycobacteriales bacterium]|jgi:hypothetical protein